MTATQVQYRGSSSATMDTALGAPREIGVNTTEHWLHVHDGSTAGGHRIPSHKALQQNRFLRCTVGGSANALTLDTEFPIPGGLEAWTELKFQANLTCGAGGVTAVINGSPPIPLRKRTPAGLAALGANDIVQDGIYDAIYDGTYLQCLGISGSGLIAVGQGDLKTSTGSVGTGSDGMFVLPGGSHGFYPNFHTSGTHSINTYEASLFNLPATSGNLYTSPACYIYLRGALASPARTITATQRFVTSSPPYTDDGTSQGAIVGGFFYALVNPAGDIVAHYLSDTPPYAYNGGTDIRCTHVCPLSGKKYRQVMVERTFEEIMDGATIQYVPQEITQEIKAADRRLIPHPFAGDLGDLRPVLLNPLDDRVAAMVAMQESGGMAEVIEQIHKGFIRVDNSVMTKRSGAVNCGVAVHKMSYKYSGGR